MDLVSIWSKKKFVLKSIRLCIVSSTRITGCSQLCKQCVANKDVIRILFSAISSSLKWVSWSSGLEGIRVRDKWACRLSMGVNGWATTFCVHSATDSEGRTACARCYRFKDIRSCCPTTCMEYVQTDSLNAHWHSTLPLQIANIALQQFEL